MASIFLYRCVQNISDLWDRLIPLLKPPIHNKSVDFSTIMEFPPWHVRSGRHIWFPSNLTEVTNKSVSMPRRDLPPVAGIYWHIHHLQTQLPLSHAVIFSTQRAERPEWEITFHQNETCDTALSIPALQILSNVQKGQPLQHELEINLKNISFNLGIKVRQKFYSWRMNLSSENVLLITFPLVEAGSGSLLDLPLYLSVQGAAG